MFSTFLQKRLLLALRLIASLNKMPRAVYSYGDGISGHWRRGEAAFKTNERRISPLFSKLSWHAETRRAGSTTALQNGARVCDPHRVKSDRGVENLLVREFPGVLRLTEPRSDKFPQAATIPDDTDRLQIWATMRGISQFEAPTLQPKSGG